MKEGRQVVRWEKKDHVATVWLADPERRNALGPEFFEQMPRVFRELGADPEVRAVVLAAEGRAFTIGLDLVAMQGTLAPTGGQAEIRSQIHAEVFRLQEAINVIADCPVPVIGVLHGWCIGGGVDIATACDLRVAAKDLKLSVRETRVAIVADLGTLQRLPRIVPKGHAAELIYTGKDVDAERCRAIGLVNDVYEDFESALAAAQTIAAEIAANSPLVVRGVKNVLRYGEDKSVEEGLKYVALWNAAFLLSDDLMEAMSAFFEKRPPKFKGA